ncbi:glyoxylate reductase [candidate division WOR_3 bacterium SM23_42]|uniref:Glyoxylate reductase n=1 Tax=candidate division WOR_3 bacterium SM23_42 TaxID=1703779 RepID=A0A0S8FX73_UNCW3|nr:MAG: glyoxylate reductase [candidate division WOR_3 bacterium SM23_42]
MAKKPKVLVTRVLPRPGMDLLKLHFDLDVNYEDQVIPREVLKEKIGNKEGLVCLLTDNIDAAIIARALRLKIIANYAVGFNNIDLVEASKRKIPVTNTPDVLTEATADLTFGLLISISRRIVEADHFLRAGTFKGWAPELLLGADVHEKTLGIIGLGRIGRAVVRRARGFDMRIIYYDNERLPVDAEKELGVQYCALTDLLREADYVSIHAPLSERTHHLLSTSEFELMKETAYVINAARGPIVDEKALVRAIKDKKIAGCALDVYENEPRVESELIRMNNVVLVPHIGSASVETRTKMALMVAENVIAVLVRKERPPNVVNGQIYGQ